MRLYRWHTFGCLGISLLSFAFCVSNLSNSQKSKLTSSIRVRGQFSDENNRFNGFQNSRMKRKLEIYFDTSTIHTWTTVSQQQQKKSTNYHTIIYNNV